MGKYRFRLSEMMPNAWFYKMKDMNKTTTKHPHNNNNNNNNNSNNISNSSQNPLKPKKLPSSSNPNNTNSAQTYYGQPRKSYYFNRELPCLKPDLLPNSPKNPKVCDDPFPDSPRKSTKRSSSRSRSRVNKQQSSSSSSSTSSKVVVASSVSSAAGGCSCRATLESVWINKSSDLLSTPTTPDYSPADSVSFSVSPLEGSSESDSVSVSEQGLASSWSSSTCTSCRQRSSSTTDILMDVDREKQYSCSSTDQKLDEFNSVPEVELPPIITKKPLKSNRKKQFTADKSRRRRSTSSSSNGCVSLSVNKVVNDDEEIINKSTLLSKEQHKLVSPVRRSFATAGSPRLIKLRANSPRITSCRKIQAANSSMRKVNASSRSSSSARKKNLSLSESFAIVKSSYDPQRDFRDSMVEMIVENNIISAKDLEELLACYLSLNSNEYHDVIVKVFEQIWFDITEIRL